jgi:acetyl-CoA carboxylase carboxyl transferase subunit beta
MMEAAYSLMQLAKTSVKLALLKQNFLTFHYVQTQQQEEQPFPAMLGDINISEPGH